MKHSGGCLFCLTFFLTACGEKVTEVEKVSESPRRPNVFVVLADDLKLTAASIKRMLGSESSCCVGSRAL